MRSGLSEILFVFCALPYNTFSILSLHISYYFLLLYIQLQIPNTFGNMRNLSLAYMTVP